MPNWYDTATITGTIESMQTGVNVGKFTWTASTGSNAWSVIGSGDLSNDPCNTLQGGCTVSVILDASKFCTVSNTPVTITVTLTAYQQSLSKSDEISVSAGCQKVFSPPPGTLLLNPSGNVLAMIKRDYF